MFALVGNIAKGCLFFHFKETDKGHRLYLFLMNNEGNELFTLRT